MLKMTEESRKFLEKNLPELLGDIEIRDALDSLYALIDEKGFAPPRYEEYNEFGREAQRVYDDLFLSGLPEEERKKYRVKDEPPLI